MDEVHDLRPARIHTYAGARVCGKVIGNVIERTEWDLLFVGPVGKAYEEPPIFTSPRPLDTLNFCTSDNLLNSRNQFSKAPICNSDHPDLLAVIEGLKSYCVSESYALNPPKRSPLPQTVLLQTLSLNTAQLVAGRTYAVSAAKAADDFATSVALSIKQQFAALTA